MNTPRTSCCIADGCGKEFTIRETETSLVPFAKRYCPECLAKKEPTYADGKRGPIVEVRKHYIAMSGLHGCLPDHCEVFETRKDAIEDLVSLFELGRTRKARLSKTGYLELTPTPIEQADEDFIFGADYCEITECTCSNPAVHSDSGSFETRPQLGVCTIHNRPLDADGNCPADTPFPCLKCSARFASIEDLDKHQHTAHGATHEPYSPQNGQTEGH